MLKKIKASVRPTMSDRTSVGFRTYKQGVPCQNLERSRGLLAGLAQLLWLHFRCIRFLPLQRLGVVLRHALTVSVKQAEVDHGARIALVSGLLVPLARLGVVLRHA